MSAEVAPVATTAPKTGGRWIEWIAWLVIAVAAACRFYLWWLNRSLWIDESYLAVNILERPFSGLHQPLEYSQSAPWLFLVACKALTLPFGESERVLRLLPLCASILVLPLFWDLLRRCVQSPAARLGAFVFLALGGRALYYAQEVKQYESDILVTTLLLWLAVRTLQAEVRPTRWFVITAFTGAVAIVAMHSTPFVLAGIGAVFFVSRWRGRLDVAYGWFAGAAVLWLSVFAVNYHVIIAPNYTDHVMKAYWAFAYPPLPWRPGALHVWKTMVSESLTYFSFSGLPKFVALGLLGLGALQAVLRPKAPVWIVVLIVGLYLVAAMAGKAPVFGRLLLFLLPAQLLLVAYGAEWLSARVHVVAALALVAVFVAPTLRRLPRIPHLLDGRPDLRTPVVALSQRIRPGEPAYIFFRAQPPLRYYRRVLQLPRLAGDQIVFGLDCRYWKHDSPGWRTPTPRHDLDRVRAEIAHALQPTGSWILLLHLKPDESQIVIDRIKADVTPDVTADTETVAGLLLRVGPPAP